MRVAVHTDYEYHRVGEEIHGEHAFTLFFIALSEQVEEVVLLGRLDPSGARARYPLGGKIRFVSLPYYRALWRLRESAGAMFAALKSFRRVLDDVDAVWLLGPHPLQLAFALLAALRGKRIVLGVRQEFPRYVASRHPGKPAFRIAALVLEGLWLGLGRFVGVVVVGPALARRYRHSSRLLEITASLVSDSDLVDPEWALEREYTGPLRALSVGRISAEKNPLLLAATLAALRSLDPRWTMTVVGEGPMLAGLEQRLIELGVREHAALHGYVPFGEQLLELYRDSHTLVHVSWTEGLPQVLIEAFAAGLPVVATDVGGIRAAIGDSALLVPPDDADALAESLARIAREAPLREELVRRACAWVHERTIERESARVAAFLGAPSAS